MLARNIGYRDGQLPATLTESGRTMLERANELLEPRWLWLPTNVTVEKEAVICRPSSAGRLSVGPLVAQQVRGSQAVALFVVTIGARLEETARHMLADGQALEGYMLDAIGSAGAEACGDVLESELSAAAAPLGWRITNRFSPGYCTWETADQQALFALLPDSPGGVALSDSSLMRPLKSISGIIGLGEEVEHKPYPCESCTIKDCHARLVDSRLGRPNRCTPA